MTLRQFLAACLALLAAPFLRRKKPEPLSAGHIVGPSFARGGLMLGAMQDATKHNLDYTRLARQMLDQRASYITLYPSDRA